MFVIQVSRINKCKIFKIIIALRNAKITGSRKDFNFLDRLIDNLTNNRNQINHFEQ